MDDLHFDVELCCITEADDPESDCCRFASGSNDATNPPFNKFDPLHHSTSASSRTKNRGSRTGNLQQAK